ncbi:MAG TPA: hypothetical protein VMG80_06325 [Solirubrobacteraceae bacterium]|nr:hypothetical protein [Solirubrobacteraceae bacterium]
MTGTTNMTDGAAGTPEPGVSALERLADLLSEQGGLMATLLVGVASANGARDASTRSVATPDGSAQTAVAEGPAQIAAAGPRARRAPAEYELLVEAIYEGYLLHNGSPRLLDPPEADLGLLAGDRLYALGLARLVELGDVEAVAELADTITLSALAQASGDEDLAGAVWVAGARAVGWGSSPQHRHAKELTLAGSPEAIEAMRTSAGGVAAPR